MLNQKITIQTDADFTPAGKRNARIVKTSTRFGEGRQLRWYVAGNLYRRMQPTADNIELTREWLAA
jgi:hypothetical protein